MKVLEQREDGTVVIELGQHELGIIGLVGTEFTQGPFAPSDEDWETAIPDTSRNEVIELFDSLP